MKKLFAIVVIYFLVFSGSVRFQGVYSNAATTAYTSNKVTVLKYVDTEKVWDDSTAEYRLKLMNQTVKIRENVIATDITGMIIPVDDITSGSGVVVAIDVASDSSLIMTAEHVCSNLFEVGEIVGGKYKILSTEKEIITYKGKYVKARVLYKDEVNDVCIMEANAIVGESADIGGMHPPVGATVTTVGAPAGHWDRGLANLVDGIFIGYNPEKICVPGKCYSNMLQFSIPIVGGMSGSAVYYKGQVFALVTVGTNQYEHIGWGPGLMPIRNAYDIAYKMWQEKISKNGI